MSADRAIGIIFAAVCVLLIAAWVSDPPAARPSGAVPSPTAVVQRDEGVERNLCDYVRDTPAEGVDLAYIDDAGRDPRIRFALAMAASTYARDGSAGGREQLLISCTRAGYR
jgi:hypothetical protein